MCGVQLRFTHLNYMVHGVGEKLSKKTYRRQQRRKRITGEAAQCCADKPCKHQRHVIGRYGADKSDNIGVSFCLPISRP